MISIYTSYILTKVYILLHPYIGSSWPELVGVEGCKAKETIEKENSLVSAIVIWEYAPVTSDFRCDRVWVPVNKHNIVTKTPVIT
ncbi:hypothetical protein Leryth_026057 [Lithospermum erythrorhizon]|nr:hypothetical protein Leryth_026057 [Lithospermum erythrorhizon]